jgi:purine-nucleoside phosphorylase
MTAAVAIVAGSGLDLRPLLTRTEEELPFASFPGLSRTTVPGHGGAFVRGCAGQVPVILQCGRLHLYEGCGLRDVVAPVEILRELDAVAIVFTNAAGGLLPGMQPGSLMGVERVMTWPCRDWPGQPPAIPVDFTIPECEFAGSYTWVLGPSYETRAEIRALRRMGAGAVGMSTAPELHHARRLGLRTAAVSCITNSCLQPQPLSHDHVLAIAERTSGKLVKLLERALPHVPL